MTIQPARPRRIWDLVLTIVFLLLHIGFVLVASAISVTFAFFSDSCGVVECNTDQIATGMLLGAGAPIAIGILVLIVSIVLLIVRRVAFWVPLVGSVLVLAVEVAAFFIAASAVSGFLGGSS